MSKESLIIETLAFMQGEEKELLKKRGKSLGEIVDNGFTDETKAYVKLMNSLYALYDDLKAETEAERLAIWMKDFKSANIELPKGAKVSWIKIM